jgi:hypothetical protein
MLADAPERPQGVLRPRPGSLPHIVVGLPDAIAVLIVHPLQLPWGIVHRRAPPAQLRQVDVAALFVGVGYAAGRYVVLDSLLQGLPLCVLERLQADLSRFTPDYAHHRRPVRPQGPCPPFLLARCVGASPESRRSVPFLPRVVVHLVGLSMGVGRGQRLGGRLVSEPLEAAPQPRQVVVVAVEFAGQLGCGGALDQSWRRRI